MSRVGGGFNVKCSTVCIGVVRVTKSYLPCSRYLLRPSRYSLLRQIELFISQYSQLELHGHSERDFNEENYLNSAHKFISAPCAKKAGFLKRTQDLHTSRVNYISSPQNSSFCAVLPLPLQSEHRELYSSWVRTRTTRYKTTSLPAVLNQARRINTLDVFII